MVKSKDKEIKNIKSLLKKTGKKIKIRKQQVSLTLPDIKKEKKWEEPNRFFKSELEETKRSMFLR